MLLVSGCKITRTNPAPKDQPTHEIFSTYDYSGSSYLVRQVCKVFSREDLFAVAKEESLIAITTALNHLNKGFVLPVFSTNFVVSNDQGELSKKEVARFTDDLKAGLIKDGFREMDLTEFDSTNGKPSFAVLKNGEALAVTTRNGQGKLIVIIEACNNFRLLLAEAPLHEKTMNIDGQQRIIQIDGNADFIPEVVDDTLSMIHGAESRTDDKDAGNKRGFFVVTKFLMTAGQNPFPHKKKLDKGTYAKELADQVFGQLDLKIQDSNVMVDGRGKSFHYWSSKPGEDGKPRSYHIAVCHLPGELTVHVTFINGQYKQGDIPRDQDVHEPQYRGNGSDGSKGSKV